MPTYEIVSPLNQVSMRQRLYIFALIACIILGCLVAALGVRSYFRWDTLDLVSMSRGNLHDGFERDCWINSNFGSLQIWLITQEWHNSPVTNRRMFPNQWMKHIGTPADGSRVGGSIRYWGGEDAIGFDGLGFGAGYYDHRRSDWDRQSQAYIRAPHWGVALLLIVPSAYLLRKRLILNHRRKFGLCLACGYDLRASPERCPECGTETRENPHQRAEQNHHSEEHQPADLRKHQFV